MKKQIKKYFGFVLAVILIISMNGSMVSAQTARHFCIKYTSSSTYYGITADIYLPSTVNVVNNNSDYVDWYIGMDSSKDGKVEGGISYKNGQFRVFLNTGSSDTPYSEVYSSIRAGQKVNLKIRLDSTGNYATLYLNGTSVKKLRTNGTFTGGKGKGKIVMGVQDYGSSSHSKAYFANVKLCANSAGTNYTTMTSNMGSYDTYHPGTPTNPYSISSTFPISASLNKG